MSDPRGEALIPGDYPDPSLLRVDDDYYLTHSSFNWAPGLLIWHSTDLRRWTPRGVALADYDGDVWAPELVHHGGRFFVYYKTTGGNHVVHAPSIDGPWSAPVDLHLGHIDPGHVVARDGRRWLHLSGGHAVALGEDGLSVVGEPRRVYRGWPFPDHWAREGLCLEGPKLFWKDDHCYLVSAQGGTAGPATSHMVLVARGPDATGPFENAPDSPLIHTASRAERWWSRGHGTLFEGPGGAWFGIDHAYERGFHTLGRQTLLERIRWRADGWPETLDERELIAPATPNGNAHYDDFGRDALDLQWRFWGEHDRARYRVGGGELVLQARGSGPDDTSPLALIPGDHAYECEVELELEGECEAGLLLFYDPRCFAGVSVNAAGEARCLRQGRRPPHHSRCDARDRLTLRLRNDRHELCTWLREGDGDWRLVGSWSEVSGYHHNTFGGFLSLRPALCAYGSGAARFRRFRYRRLA